MVLGFDLGFGGRSGGVDVLVASFVAYGTSFCGFWQWRHL